MAFLEPAQRFAMGTNNISGSDWMTSEHSTGVSDLIYFFLILCTF